MLLGIALGRDRVRHLLRPEDESPAHVTRFRVDAASRRRRFPAPVNRIHRHFAGRHPAGLSGRARQPAASGRPVARRARIAGSSGNRGRPLAVLVARRPCRSLFSLTESSKESTSRADPSRPFVTRLLAWAGPGIAMVSSSSFEARRKASTRLPQRRWPPVACLAAGRPEIQRPPAVSAGRPAVPVRRHAR